MREPGQEAEYDQLLADIAEGARLHYDGRGEDPDLALLEGDQMYARGLARLADLGDLEAIRELADVISLVAQSRAGGDAELATAVWRAGVHAVRHGGDSRHEAAKELARSGDPDATRAMENVARLRGLRKT